MTLRRPVGYVGAQERGGAVICPSPFKLLANIALATGESDMAVVDYLRYGVRLERWLLCKKESFWVVVF